MKIEELEKKIKEKLKEKYTEEERKDKKEYFILQIRATYKGKEIIYSDQIKSNKPVITVEAKTYDECFESLLKMI